MRLYICWRNIAACFVLQVIALHSYAQSHEEVKTILREQVMQEASWAMAQQPVTVTASVCERSAGGKHDFYSEGDYWWPDTTNLSGPYIQRDGMTNPNNFTAHREAMIRFSRIIGALTSAYILTHDKKYLNHAIAHLKAWFINVDTRMNPNLQYAQAIKGRATGRGIGIIDTIHLIEVARGIAILDKAAILDGKTKEGLIQWFSDYLTWLTTHAYGKDEMNAKNNHGTCWVMQVAAFAKLTNNETLLDFCRERYRSVLLPEQMAQDGSFPLELKRTKPYGYSIFNLDAMATVCYILSDSKHDLWNYTIADGRSIRKGIEFLYPYIKDKSQWPYPHDVMYDEYWPVAQPFLFFGALVFKKQEWFDVWKHDDHQPQNAEVLRNLPIRHPLLWLE